MEMQNLNQVPRAGHFSVSPSSSRGIVSIDNPHLPTLIGLTECITALLAHALHLPDFPDRFLELLHTGAVVLNIVLLNFLNVVVVLWVVHPLGVLPGIVAEETEAGENNRHQVEDGGGEQTRNGTVIFFREANCRCRITIGWEESEPDDHRTRDGNERIFRPNVGNQCSFPKNSS